MATTAYAYDSNSAHYPTSVVSHYLQDGSHPSRPSSRAANGTHQLSQPYTKYVGRQVILAWKRISRATRKPERASRLPEGFVIINSRRGAYRRSILFA
ncbi:hypothetical protein DFH11DRAFT_1723415 [Phellopilus nigrolimitatus]|nr:hypothetical protein DFH11DRAFT_1723415 [Phellopilus nigrolimitatus]